MELMCLTEGGVELRGTQLIQVLTNLLFFLSLIRLLLTSSSFLEAEALKKVVKFGMSGKFLKFHVDSSADTSSLMTVLILKRKQMF